MFFPFVLQEHDENVPLVDSFLQYLRLPTDYFVDQKETNHKDDIVLFPLEIIDDE